jgi:rfaE bifunctional protein kinase chain/domain
MHNNLKEILSRFNGKKIIVWGDLILDEYIYTTTGRISREAPVLVTEFESNEYILGGAGNVVMNVKALGAIPVPVALIGTNSDGKTLKKILKKNDIETGFLVELDDYHTPKKSRILSGGENTKKQQVLRIDTLNKTNIHPSANEKIEATLLELLKTIDFLVISDYIYKSVNPAVFNRVREQFPSKTFIIDSRQHLTEFKGVSIATPNEPEIKKLFPEKNFFSQQDFFDAGTELLERLYADGVVLKRGHKGMIVFEKERPPQQIGIHGSSDIVDVTGAGDTVISVLSLALSSGADLVSASQLANIAAGIVVMKEGCYPIGARELEHELE